MPGGPRGPPAGVFTVDVRFRAPILLPAAVAFSTGREDGAIGFAVSDARRRTPHLDGEVAPSADGNRRQTEEHIVSTTERGMGVGSAGR